VSWIDGDGAQGSAGVFLSGMQLPCPGARVDLTGKIVSLGYLRGC
jgi:hypothetical protein